MLIKIIYQNNNIIVRRSNQGSLTSSLFLQIIIIESENAREHATFLLSDIIGPFWITLILIQGLHLWQFNLNQTFNASRNVISYPSNLIKLFRDLTGDEVQTVLHWPTLSRHRSSFKWCSLTLIVSWCWNFKSVKISSSNVSTSLVHPMRVVMSVVKNLYFFQALMTSTSAHWRSHYRMFWSPIVSFIPFLVFGVWSLLAKKLQKY